ncbi:MAG: hypothetical protein HKN14_03620 [Marinicaulis sp.]|nr:hypothetical protein [Marinicaulis sp.]NNE39992.1 hypothetical protein [Marinicaulis sp.]
MWVIHDKANGKCDAFSCAVKFAAHIKNMKSLDEDGRMFFARKNSMWVNDGECDAAAMRLPPRCVGDDRQAGSIAAGPAGGSIKQVSVVTNV